MSPGSAQEREELISRLYTDLRGFGLVPIEETIGPERPISTLRRGRLADPDDGVGLATLVDEDGVLCSPAATPPSTSSATVAVDSSPAGSSKFST